MQSVLDKTVSCFANYRTPDNPAAVNLLTWLTSEKYRAKVEYIRGCTDQDEIKALKSGLPAITPSGIFSERKETALIEHSGLICIDIDAKDNPNLANWQDVPEILRKLANVAYAGLSVSGNGYFAILPILRPERHRHHFYALQRDFLALGIVIDPACKDVSRLRGYSYDSAPYFNHNAQPYRKLFDPDHRPRHRQHGNTDWSKVNSEIDTVAVLQAHGWEVVKEDARKIYVRRPGHTTALHSGNVLKSTGQFYCWTSSAAPFEPGECYSAYRVQRLMENAHTP